MACKTDPGERLWVRIWLVAVLIAGTSIASVEFAARDYGYKPDVPDSLALWFYHRHRVVGGDPKLIVAIGTSRIRAALSPEVASECLPGCRLIQLGFDGPSGAVGLLDELSATPGFCGTILCDVPVPLFDRSHWDDQPNYYRKQQSPSSIANSVFSSVLREHSVALVDDMTLRRLIFGNSPPEDPGWPEFFRTHLDRSVTVDGARADIISAAGRAKFPQYKGLYTSAKRYANVQEFKQTVAPLRVIVERIRRNHGAVVFLRLPSAGPRLEFEESNYPTGLYYSALAEATSATCIDFRSLPQASDFQSADGSHLSPDGARVFTRALIRQLKQRHLVASSETK